MTVAAFNGVIASAGGDRVVTVATVDEACSDSDRDGVVTVAGNDRVIQVDRPGDRVVAVAAGDRHAGQPGEVGSRDAAEVNSVGSAAAADTDRRDVSDRHVSERCRLKSVFDDLQRHPVHRIRPHLD